MYCYILRQIQALHVFSLSNVIILNIGATMHNYIQQYAVPINSIVLFQSIQITTFLFTVCHVVILVQDWFCDLNVMR